MSKTSAKLTSRLDFYKSLTVQDLKIKCREKGVTGFTGLKKNEIIELLMANVTPEKVLPTAKSSKKDPIIDFLEETGKMLTEKNKEVFKEIAQQYQEKPPARAPKQSVASIPIEDIKPSGLMHVSYVKSLIDAVALNIRKGDKAGAIYKAEQLKAIIDKYTFDYTFEQNIRDSIKSVLEEYEPKQPKKKVIVIKGDYSKMDVSDLNFTKSSKKQRISITLEELVKEIENPSFIRDYTNSIKDLMKAKTNIYLEKKKQIEKEYGITATKIEKLKSTGTSEKTIERLYPDFDDLKCFAVELGEIVDLVRTKARDINDEVTKKNLLDAVTDPEEGLASIVGRDTLKNQLAAQIYSFSKGYNAFIGSFNNIAIYGASGSGKSKLAIVIGFVFSKIGVLAKGSVKIVSRTDLVAQYIGQTGPRTRSVLMDTLEGVLFIDEAYQLAESAQARQGSRDFGMEAVTELVNFLDKYIGLNVVIVAGYEHLMKANFMTANEGLPRRFPYCYKLPSYTIGELTDILLHNLRRKVPENIKIDGETSNYIFSVVDKLFHEKPQVFVNQAGDMLNLSASINKAIGSSFKIKWENGELGNNTPIILAGVEDFLDVKGV